MRSLEVIPPFRTLLIGILLSGLSTAPVLLAQSQQPGQARNHTGVQGQQRSRPSANQNQSQILEDQSQQPPNAHAVPGSASTAPPPAPAAHSP